MGSPNEPDLVPPENQPGHHPPEEQDKPDLNAFAAKLGTDPKAPTRKATPAERPAAVLAPTPEEAAHFSAPQPAPEDPEPRLVGLVLLPLRETVKRLEQLDRKLTERLATKVRGSRGR